MYLTISDGEESDDEQEVVPISEIFICFGQEEFFEGDQADGNNFDFDIIEHLNDDEIQTTP